MFRFSRINTLCKKTRIKTGKYDTNLTYYSLGKWIVEVQQKGQKRAKYGSQVIKKLSNKLQSKFGKVFLVDTL